MNAQVESNHLNQNLDPLSHRRLNGIGLIGARLLWAVVFIAHVGAFLYLLPAYYDRKLQLAESIVTRATAPLYAGAFVARDVLTMVVFVLFAIIIFWRRPDTTMTIFTSILLIQMGAGTGFVFGNVPADLPFGQLLGGLAQDAIGVTVGAFLFVFPNGRFRPRWTKFLVIGMAALTLLWTTFPRSSPLHTTNIIDAPGWDFVQTLYILTSLGVMIYRYRNTRVAIERQQSKWLIYTLTVLVFSQLLWVVFSSLQITDTPDLFFDLGIATIFFFLPSLGIPISIAFAILQYRLWDIDVLVNRSLVYVTLTGFLGILFFASVYLLQIGFRTLSGQSSEVAIVLTTLLIAVLARPMHGRVQDLIDRAFYRSKIDAQKAVLDFTREVRMIVDRDELLKRLVEKLTSLLQVASVAIFLQDVNESDTEHIDDQKDRVFDLKEGDIAWHKSDGPHPAEETSRGPLNEYRKDQSADRELELSVAEIHKLQNGSSIRQNHLLLPLIAQRAEANELIGVMALGPRLSGQGYSSEERSLLEGLALQAGTSGDGHLRGAASRNSASEIGRSKPPQERVSGDHVPRTAYATACHCRIR
ncbi:GAF domain-containing protein [Chloroflexi bacterium TSY]|nr:GAF domain-containing protein [Chloroflexi bacterium TSY]